MSSLAPHRGPAAARQNSSAKVCAASSRRSSPRVLAFLSSPPTTARWPSTRTSTWRDSASGDPARRFALASRLALRRRLHPLAVTVSSAHGQHLLHLSDELARLVAHLDDEGRLEALAGVGGDADELDLRARNFEAGGEGAAARA